jgi:hypothetical protein
MYLQSLIKKINGNVVYECHFWNFAFNLMMNMRVTTRCKKWLKDFICINLSVEHFRAKNIFKSNSIIFLRGKIFKF